MKIIIFKSEEEYSTNYGSIKNENGKMRKILKEEFRLTYESYIGDIYEKNINIDFEYEYSLPMILLFPILILNFWK